MIAPTTEEIRELAGLCSRHEWELRLLQSQRFLQASAESVEAMERVAGELLGRRVSISRESLRNREGDESL